MPAESTPATAAATSAEQAATCAHTCAHPFCFKDHRCGLGAIQRVIHFDRNVNPRDVARDIGATVAFQLIRIGESTVFTRYVKHLSCQLPGQSLARSTAPPRCGLVAAMIVEGCMQAL